ncbi:hypothetical protein LTR17_027263 [Elasticomyces elasticus]|nr:hypothetical protein LTR17_027263 [Elasticomyces elasticus]
MTTVERDDGTSFRYDNDLGFDKRQAAWRSVEPEVQDYIESLSDDLLQLKRVLPRWSDLIPGLEILDNVFGRKERNPQINTILNKVSVLAAEEEEVKSAQVSLQKLIHFVHGVDPSKIDQEEFEQLLVTVRALMSQEAIQPYKTSIFDDINKKLADIEQPDALPVTPDEDDSCLECWERSKNEGQGVNFEDIHSSDDSEAFYR